MPKINKHAEIENGKENLSGLNRRRHNNSKKIYTNINNQKDIM